MPVNESAKALLKHLSRLADRSIAGGGELHPDLRAAINYAASIWAAAEGYELNIDDAAMIAEAGPLGLQKFCNKYGLNGEVLP